MVSARFHWQAVLPSARTDSRSEKRPTTFSSAPTSALHHPKERQIRALLHTASLQTGDRCFSTIMPRLLPAWQRPDCTQEAMERQTIGYLRKWSAPRPDVPPSVLREGSAGPAP